MAVSAVGLGSPWDTAFIHAARFTREANMVAPLHGVVVLDLSRLLPGPYATQVLADLGARVIKVEDSAAGDSLRPIPPLVGEHGAMFLALNRGKQSITLDLRQPEGAATFKNLVRHSHVVVEGFRPGVMRRLGLDFPALQQVNPRVVMCSISGFGQDGPDRSRAGHDLGYLARSGVLGAGQPGWHPPLPVADMGGALWAVVQILAALRKAEQSGEGAHVDISLTEAAWSFLTMPLAAELAGGEPLQAGRNLLNGGVPAYRTYSTLDGGTLAVAALEPPFWNALCSALERPDLRNRGLAQDEEGRQVGEELARIFRQRTSAEWRAFFRGRDCCVEVAWAPGQAHMQDAQLQGRQLTVEVEQPGAGTVELPITPIRIGGHQVDAARPAPTRGQHTREVLSALADPPGQDGTPDINGR